MEDLIIVIGTVAGVVTFEALAWFLAFDSRDASPHSESPVVGPGHRPTWF